MKSFYAVLVALLVFFTVAMSPGVASAQNKTYWLETYQGAGSISSMPPLLTCPDGGALVVSYTKDANGIKGSILTKVTSNGSVEWTKEYFGGRVIINALQWPQMETWLLRVFTSPTKHRDSPMVSS